MDAIRRIRSVTTEVCIIDTQVLRVSSPATTAWITEDNLIETPGVIGLIEEPDAVWNPAAGTTGLSFVMNEAALLMMLVMAGTLTPLTAWIACGVTWIGAFFYEQAFVRAGQLPPLS